VGEKELDNLILDYLIKHDPLFPKSKPEQNKVMERLSYRSMDNIMRQSASNIAKNEVTKFPIKLKTDIKVNTPEDITELLINANLPNTFDTDTETTKYQDELEEFVKTAVAFGYHISDEGVILNPDEDLLELFKRRYTQE
jgi:hypothetical protein